ncbi:Na/Pi symporter [Roseococcus sp. YIM B11640]|uniref:Na/Pi symporter n=1 Tax=Roseococcus sp. YIM B11640 TaxID=3133973 RepID=UPI003C7BA896
MEALASLFGGLGLFFIGVKGLSGQLSALAGSRMRAAMAHGTAGPWRAGLLGLVLGLVTQSSSAVTFIAASMRAAGLIAPRRVLPILAWANAGTAGLVLLATLDLRVMALWLLGLVGCVSYFAPEGGGRWRPALGAASGLALMLLGLGLIKLGAAPLREWEVIRAVIAFGGDAWLPPFILGALVTLVAQSSSTVSILAITLRSAGLVSFDQAVAAIYGASLGSGLAVWILAGGLQGTARQPVIFQALLRFAGAALFLLAMEVERVFDIPLVIAAVEAVTHAADLQLALIFLLLQVVTALLAAPLHQPLERLLGRLAPESAVEADSRPRFLYPQAIEDAPSALALVAAEQGRLHDRIPRMLDPVRAEPDGGDAVIVAASAALEQEIARFIAALLAREMPAEALADAVRLQARLGLLATLRETVSDFVAEGSALPDPQVLRPFAAMAEALHMLVSELRDLDGPESASWLAELASDRGEMMQRLRRQALGLAQERLFALTGLFERGVWLVRRLALLETEQV